MSKSEIIFLTKLNAAQIEKGRSLPSRLIAIGKEIEATVFKFQTYETKASDLAVSIKALLAEAATYCDKGGFNAFRNKFCPSLGRSRTYELLAIASGKKTQDQSKAQGAARQAKYQTKLKKGAVSVSDGQWSTLTQNQSKAQGAAQQAKCQANPKKTAASVSDGQSSALRQFTASVLELVL